MGQGVTRAKSRAALRVSFVLSLLGSACADFDLTFADPEPPPIKPRLWTLFDMQAALGESDPERRNIAQSITFPTGFAVETFLVPNRTGATLRVIPAFSEGDAAAYVLTEIWVGFREIWVQPWYFLVSAWDDKSPQMNRAKYPADPMMNYPPIWEVHPRSLFYSPFWQVYYALLPAGADPTRYTSAEKIINDKLPLYLGPPFIYSARPDAITLDMRPVHPYLEAPVATFLNQSPVSFVDDEKIAYFSQGSNGFKFDSKQVVEEVPMFLFVRRNDKGSMVLLNAPNVIGTGPLFARRPADAPGGRPRFGSYSRFHLAVVPATAAAFDPDAHPEAAALLTAKMLDPRAYRGRMATNGACFADMVNFPAGCTWLDSQARIEDALGAANLQRTEISSCSTVVFYGGKGIGR
jgi:hypothetical protein